MAQCGGIGVGELNKLELDLCERLHWKLLPSAAELQELLDALSSPAAPFWSAWYNAPRAIDTAAAGSAASSDRATGSRLPHAKSVADSLGRLFRRPSEGNLGTLQEAGSQAGAPAPSSARAPSNAPPAHKPAAAAAAAAPPVADSRSKDDGSPRSVVVNRTFSLSNLFGLASW